MLRGGAARAVPAGAGARAARGRLPGATGRYLLRIEATFEAAPEQLLAVLTDYARIHELHPALLESRSLGTIAPDTEEVYTRFEGCVLLFCRTLHRVEHIRVVDTALLLRLTFRARLVQRGRHGVAFSTTEQRTHRLHYEARFIPAFRVTPIFGATALARSVERMTVELMAEVERRAMQAS
jgi:hypothetical protein